MGKIKDFLMSKVFSVTLLLCTLLFCIDTVLNAQSQFSIGPEIGLNTATFHLKDVGQYIFSVRSQDGLYIGGIINYQFAELFSLQTGAAYTVKGAETNTDVGDYYYSLNYIEIPVLFKFFFPTGSQKVIKLNLFAGPTAAFNVASEAGTGDSEGYLTEINNIKVFDFGLAFGGGIGFPTRKGILDFSLRYTLGLTPVFIGSSNAGPKNYVISVITDYAFRL
jgi:hypothetical protein